MKKNKENIGWILHFNKYSKAMARLRNAIMVVIDHQHCDKGTDDLMNDGLIQRFEYTHELAWKVMRDYSEYQGYKDVGGFQETFRHALQMGIIDDEAWMESIEDRKLISHYYDEATANTVCHAITYKYYPLFVNFEKVMQSLSESDLT